jgi:hypothetical protein
MVEPTAPPRCLPPWNSGGQVKVPLTVMVPVPTSASSATSAKGMCGSGSLSDMDAASPTLDLGLAHAEALGRRGDQDALEVLGGIQRGVADHEGDARRIGTVVLRRDQPSRWR